MTRLALGVNTCHPRVCVLGLFPAAGCAIVVESNWMKTMRAAVRSHVTGFLHSGAAAVSHSLPPLSPLLGLMLSPLILLAMLAMVEGSLFFSASIVVNLFVV